MNYKQSARVLAIAFAYSIKIKEMCIYYVKGIFDIESISGQS